MLRKESLMIQGEDLKKASSNNIDDAILQTDILEGDRTILRSLVFEVEW